MASVTLGDDVLSWDELQARAEAIRPSLAGARAVAIVAEPNAHVVASLLAAMAAGIPAVPISADSGPGERAHVLADSGVDLLVEDGSLTEIDSSARPIAPEAALILYTSGTTGPPKGVQLSTAAINACLDALAAAWEWSPDDLLVHGLPLHHVHGLVLGVLGPLRVGSALRHTGRPTPEAYAASGGTLFFGVPTVWSRIAREESAARALAGARLLVSGSAALPRPAFDALFELCGQAPIERYGMTETLITVSARAADPRAQGSAGRALDTVRTRIVDESGAELPSGGDAMGELHVRAASMFSGYLNLPEATRANFTPDGWFTTGDVARIDADGVHRIVGRASVDMIKSGGFRIGAGEIEDALLSHPGVAEAAVVGLPDDDLGQRIVAFVVASGCTAEDLITHVVRELSWHKRPREVVFLEALPRNAMGKVTKALLVNP